MKQIRYKKASQMSICGPWERNILAHEFISIFVPKKKRSKKHKMINPSWEPHQVTKQK
jgi:hypothetical protein